MSGADRETLPTLRVQADVRARVGKVTRHSTFDPSGPRGRGETLIIVNASPEFLAAPRAKLAAQVFGLVSASG